MVGVVEKRSKQKGEYSNSKRESAVKKQKSNSYDKNEVKMFLVGARNNLNWCWHRTSQETWIQQIVGCLVGDNGEASNGGFGAGVGDDEDCVSMVGIIGKRSKRRKCECSILKREFAAKKYKSNNFDKNEIEKFLSDTRNNLYWCWHRTSRGSWIQQIVGGLVSNGGGTSNGRI